MSILELITEIGLCLFAAAVLGFAVGWIFSILFKNEKMAKKYNLLQEEYEVKQSDIHRLEEELDARHSDFQELELKLTECEKEKLSRQMDQEDCERYINQIKELQSENNMLISQIKEQKLCEDENEILENEIKALEEEKQALLDKLDDYKEYKNNYKALIMEIEALKSEKGKLQYNTNTPQQEKTTEDKLSKTSYEKILKDVLKLKEETKNIKDEKKKLQTKLHNLQNQLTQTKEALQECHKLTDQNNRILPPQMEFSPKDTTIQKTSQKDIDKEVCNNSDENVTDDELKTLSDLIRDALDDVKKD